MPSRGPSSPTASINLELEVQEQKHSLLYLHIFIVSSSNYLEVKALSPELLKQKNPEAYRFLGMHTKRVKPLL